MGKTKKQNAAPPSFDPNEAMEETTQDEKQEQPAVPVEPTTGVVILQAPSQAWLGGAVIRNPTLHSLPRRYGAALRRLFLSLQERGETLSNGDQLNHQGQALLWLLEQYAAGLGADELQKMVDETTS